MSIEKMTAKATELKEKWHSTREICQEMHLSQATVEWFLAKQASDSFNESLPPDVKVGWRTIGVSGSRIASIAEIMADVILEEQEKHGFDLNEVNVFHVVTNREPYLTLTKVISVQTLKVLSVRHIRED